MAIIQSNVRWNSWRDQLSDASFRDVPFKVISHTEEGGRRTFLHQFPFNDTPYLEDFGKDAGVYRIEAYIVQSIDNNYNYFTERDNLRKALTEQGYGTLIHPFLGTIKVGVQGKFQLKESFEEGGVARFTITFVDSGEPQQPKPRTTILDLDEKQTTLWEKFKNALQTVNEIGHVVDSALLQAQYYVSAAQSAIMIPLTVASSVISQANTTLATVKGTIATVISIPDQCAALLAQVSDVFKSMTELIPSDTENISTTSVGTTSELILSDVSLVNACLTMSTFGSDFQTITPTTDAMQAQLDNQNLMIDTVRATSMVEAVRAATAVNYRSYEDAAAMRDALIDAFDYVIDGIGENSKDDIIFQVMQDTKQYAVDAMIAKGADLPKMHTLTVPTDIVPSLIYAQILYKDIDREAEIIARNPKIMRHPGFPLGGLELKVLNE